MARLRGFKVTQKQSSVNNAFGRLRDFFVGNF
jgi:cell division protein FtsA